MSTMASLVKALTQQKALLEVAPNPEGKGHNAFRADLTCLGGTALVEKKGAQRTAAVAFGASAQGAESALMEQLRGNTVVFPARPADIRVQIPKE